MGLNHKSVMINTISTSQIEIEIVKQLYRDQFVEKKMKKPTK